MIEYSKNGMPHLHALIWLHPDLKQFLKDPCQFIFAKKENPRGKVDLEYNDKIAEFNTHKHSEKCSHHSSGRARCHDGYPFPPRYTEGHDKFGRYLFLRKDEDTMIKSTNPEILKLANAHVHASLVTNEGI
jgi:hypothetical protein